MNKQTVPIQPLLGYLGPCIAHTTVTAALTVRKYSQNCSPVIRRRLEKMSALSYFCKIKNSSVILATAQKHTADVSLL